MNRAPGQGVRVVYGVENAVDVLFRECLQNPIVGLGLHSLHRGGHERSLRRAEGALEEARVEAEHGFGERRDARITSTPGTTSGTGAVTFTVTDTTVEDVAAAATDTTDGVTFTEQPSVAFVTPEVTHVTVAPGPPAAAFVAGAPTTYEVTFTTSAAGALSPMSSLS